MCGIFGFARLTYEKNFDYMRVRDCMAFLACENSTRGKDSTGLAIVNKYGVLTMARQTKPALPYLRTPLIADKIREQISKDLRAVYGHTRSATTGAVTIKNAQPFLYGQTVGTHNGIIRNWKELEKEYKFDYKTDCDSESLIALCDLGGTIKEIGARLESAQGYFALAWHNAKYPDAFYFARSSAPLSILKGPDFLLWTSEETHLEKAQVIFGFRGNKVKLKENKALLLSANLLERVHLNCKKEATFLTDGASKWSRGGKAWGRDVGFGYESNGKKWYETEGDISAVYPCGVCNIETAVKYSQEMDENLCASCQAYYETPQGREALQAEQEYLKRQIELPIAEGK